MKATLLLIFGLATANAFGQNLEKPVYYLNGEEVEMGYVRINPCNVKDFKVDKKKGVIYLKTTKPVRVITLDEILTKYTDIKDDATNVIFILDGKGCC